MIISVLLVLFLAYLAYLCVSVWGRVGRKFLGDSIVSEFLGMFVGAIIFVLVITLLGGGK